jgi:alkylated DNA repair dioxygenase AlkB
MPKCLDDLRISTVEATGCKFNFCLVNYYASGSDSISYHSDDERFLGSDPAIASFSLGAKRDFLMKHKLITPDDKAPPPAETKPIKLPLASGDMILMRGKTQANWLHSIPKRTGKNAEDGGRINITFRRAMIPGGTENYYNYNVGTGPVYKWNNSLREMKLWTPATTS